MIFCQTGITKQDTMKDSELGLFWTHKQLLKIACQFRKVIRVYGSKRKTLVKISQQTGVREHNTVLKQL